MEPKKYITVYTTASLYAAIAGVAAARGIKVSSAAAIALEAGVQHMPAPEEADGNTGPAQMAAIARAREVDDLEAAIKRLRKQNTEHGKVTRRLGVLSMRDPSLTPAWNTMVEQWKGIIEEETAQKRKLAQVLADM